MNYKIIKNILKKENGSIALLKEFSNCIAEIENIENKLETDILDIVDGREILQKITAYDLKLNKACYLLREKIEHESTNITIDIFEKTKRVQETFKAGVAKETAKKKTATDRKVLNIFEMYYKNCETIKSSIQSILKTLVEENLRLSS